MIPALIRHRGAGKPAGPIPLIHTPPPAAGGRARHHLARPRDDPDRDRRPLRADRPGVGRAGLAVGNDRPGPAACRADRRRRAPAGWTRSSSPTITTTISTCRRCGSCSARQTAPFLVPIGIGAHLRGWGVPEDRIIELDWDEQATVGELTLTCTESRHFSGRGLRRNTTLWCSWAIAGPAHRVYFGGDTGYTAAFTGIGERYGPFDITVLPIGAYGEQWPDIHLNPEEAVQAHRDLGGGLFVPIHWATFDLALHTWAEPVERLLAAGAGTADRRAQAGATDRRRAQAPRAGRLVAPRWVIRSRTGRAVRHRSAVTPPAS